ncbi:MAG: M23 family metallopeptidase [Schleiferiaceae bacterium]|nr:M23 family metallopeptidase [Schleiferiaceae bacterium]
MLNRSLILGLLLTTSLLSAQSAFAPSPPLDIPLVLSGTFAELRGNHFHGGIDIKTQGRSGLKIYSVAAGYVSRIAVNPYGYGNALYLRHPEGYTTVYGHLNAFYPELEAWVEEQLRDRSKNDGNLYPSPEQFKVTRGQLVAFSGNTGGSFGPHLHFEIRDTKTEEPLNPLKFGIEVKDTRKPDIRGLKWTAKDFSDAGSFKSGDTIKSTSALGIDLFTTDKQDLANNNNGVYAIEASIDDQTFFTANYSRINFSTSRFINAHINYDLYCSGGVRYTRLYELENNPLKITDTYEISAPAFRASKGWITVAHDSVVKLEASVKDFKGNTSEFRFYIEGNAPLSPEKKSIKLDWEKDHDLTLGAIQIHLPAGALYKTSEFNLLKKGDAQYVIGEGCVPLQTYMTLEWTLHSTQIPGVGWFLWEADHMGKKSAISGERDGAVMTFKTRSTGTYELDQDLKKPEVSLLKTTTYPRSNSTFREIRLRVADDKTGVERYSARIDERFARIDFDYKKEMLKIIVPKDIPAGSHNLRVVVIDGVGNTSVEEYTITL